MKQKEEIAVQQEMLNQQRDKVHANHLELARPVSYTHLQEYADLKTQRDSDYTKLKNTRAEVAELQKSRRCVDIALRADQPEQTQSRTKRHDIDR